MLHVVIPTNIHITFEQCLSVVSAGREHFGEHRGVGRHVRVEGRDHPVPLLVARPTLLAVSHPWAMEIFLRYHPYAADARGVTT